MKSRLIVTTVLALGLTFLLAADSSAWDHPCFHFNAELNADGMNDVNCIIEFQGTWYVGGDFETVDGQPAGGIARWNGTAWEPLPLILTNSNGNSQVEAMCIMNLAEDEQLYVGGLFDGAGEVEVYNIARWNGSAWSQVDYGLDGRVLALATGYSDYTGQFLMAGGEFEDAYNVVPPGVLAVSSHHVAMWAQGDWAPPWGTSSGLNNTVRALYTIDEQDPIGQGVCIGGDFTESKDELVTDLNHFALYRYNYQYEAPAAGMDLGPGATVNTFTLHTDSNGDTRVYLGGQFESLPGVECNLMGWNGGTSYVHTSGLDGPVYALGSVNSYYNDARALYVGGSFTTAGAAAGDPVSVSNIAIWAYDDWDFLCQGDKYGLSCDDDGTTGPVRTIVPIAQGGGSLFNSIIVGGNFHYAGGLDSPFIAIWEEAEFVTIVTEPQELLVCEGEPASFGVQATGSDLTYQWRYRPDDTSDWVPIDGATDPDYSIASTIQTDNGLFQCMVTGVCSVEYSAQAELTVGYAPVITTQPYLNADPCIGETMYIKAVFDAVPDATWQWYHDDDPIETSDIYCQVFIQDADLSDEGEYRVEITNQCDTAYSETYELTLTEGPTITQHPQSATVREGDSHTFEAAASGTNPTLQWRFGEVDIEDANSDSYTIYDIQESDEGDYDMAASNLCDTEVSNTATLTVEPNQPPTAVATADPTSGYLEPGLGLEVNFDGSESFDPEQWELGYFWEFGDGDTSDQMSPVHTYTEGGIFNAVLTVTDDRGDFHSDTVQITVLDCQVQPTHLEFALVLIGETAYETFTVTNLSGNPITIDVTEACDAFQVFAGGGQVSLQPGVPHEVTIEFSPVEFVHYDCVMSLGYALAPDVTCHGKGVYALVDYGLSSAMIAFPEAVSVVSLPDGSGNPLDNCNTSEGWWVDASITLTLFDTLGDPIEGYPDSDIWLVSTAGSLIPCCDMFSQPDGPTDLSGATTFSGPLFTGGSSVSEELVQVVIDGIPLSSSNGFDIRFNSPDIDGDCQVNLTDVSHFAYAFFFEYQYRADFLWDGVVNLSDVVFMAQGLGAGCSGAKAAPDPQDDRVRAASLAFCADSQGTESSLSAPPGQPFTVHLFLQGSAEDLLGWECRAESSANLRVLGWELAGQAVNIMAAPEFNVGLARALPAGGPIMLATARCQVTDDKPAFLGIATGGTSSFHPAAPALLLGSSPEFSRLAVAGTGEPLLINTDGVGEPLPQQPDRTALLPAAPNPFNPQTLIRFELPASDRVQLVIYSIDGRKVRTLADEVRGAGLHEVIWNGRDDHGRAMASGPYFYRLKTRDFQDTRRMLLIK